MELSFTVKPLSAHVTLECFLDTCRVSLSTIHVQMASAVHNGV